MKILLSHMGHQSTLIYFSAIPVDRQFFADYNTLKNQLSYHYGKSEN